MERFKIFGYTNLSEGYNKVNEIVITDSEMISEASTFNEKFTLEAHDKGSLDFEIVSKLENGEPNPFMNLLKPESVIGLQLLDRENETESSSDKEGSYYKFKVKGRSPKFEKDKLVYQVSCTDFARSVYSQQGVGLSIDMTGTIREIAEEVLGHTRKNVLYEDLNKDLSELSYFNATDQMNRGIKYKLPYINFSESSMNAFKRPGFSYVNFNINNKYELGQAYELHFDLVGANALVNNKLEPFDLLFEVVGISGGVVFNNDPVSIKFEGEGMKVVVPFIYGGNNSFNLKNADLLGLRIIEPTLQSGADKWPVNASRFSMSLANFKIQKSRIGATDRGGSSALFINHLDNFKKQFSNYVELEEHYGSRFKESYVSETKMTFNIENSNLYNSLVSLAELFDAQVKFDYLDNAFYFVSNKFSAFKGYKLHPDVNLSKISRPESSSNFATVLHIRGGGDIDGVMPTIPREWRMFLSDCVMYDFNKTNLVDWFSDFGVKDYTSFTDQVKRYIDSSDSLEERIHEIDRFAKHMNGMANFESTIYDFSYFNDIGLLVDVAGERDYSDLVDTIYNTVRKLNIRMNINSYNYYTIYSDFTAQLTQVGFYINGINVERVFQHNSTKKLYGEQAPDKYSTTWVSYVNALDSSKAQEQVFEEELRLVLGLSPIDKAPSLDVKPGSFTHNALMLFGYDKNDRTKNGVQKLLDENREKREEKIEEEKELLEKESKIEKQMKDETLTEFVKESLTVELAGTKQRLQDIKRYLGMSVSKKSEGTGYPGIFNLEADFYNIVRRLLNDTSTGSLSDQLRSQEVPLHELLFDRDSSRNLLRKKEKALESLLDKYEPFVLEAKYENSEEISPYGLLEQAQITFTEFNKPQISYSISSINIAAIENYEYYKHPEVGDKILLDGGLYESYENEETKYLVVSSYSGNLRDPSSTDLKVEKDDESELLVRRMLQSTNFTLGAGKPKSNLVIPLPRDLPRDIESVFKEIERLKETGLSVSDLFDDLIIK